MADVAREKKLAAAKKKLKQFQQKSGRTPSSSPAPPKQRSSSVIEKTNKKNSESVKQNSNSSPLIENHAPTTPPHNNQTTARPISPIKPVSSTKPLSPVKSLPNNRHSPSPRSSPGQDGQSRRSPFKNLGRTTPSTEGLQQISRQLNGLLNESQSYLNGTELVDDPGIQELEMRNRELAALLEKHSQANQQLTLTCQELKSHNNHVNEQLIKERSEFEERLRKDIGTLKEQLQVHIQTIGILVAEKSELQSGLNQAQKTAEQRYEEVEELSGRLKASRMRVADLERNLSTASNSSQTYEKSNKEMSKEIDRLKLDLYKANKSGEDLRQQSSELQEKLQAKVSECFGFQQSVADLRHALEMKEVLIQQLSNRPENPEDMQLIEQLQQEKMELSNRIEQYNEAFQKLTTERDQIAEQYQRYIEQLQQKCQELESQINALNREKELLIKTQKELEESVERLQEQLANAPPSANPQLQETIQELSLHLEKVKFDYGELQRKYEAQIQDNSQLSRLVEEKEGRIVDLESSIEQMGEDTCDKTKLLENIQSDKTALSRAMTQNKELKSQLAELQNGFVKMSNENMDLLTQVQSEQHISHELGHRLGHQEEELNEIRHQLLLKEQELSRLEEHSKHVNTQMLKQDQLEDRIKHYEAQAMLVETLQRELNASQDTINALTTQNHELHNMVVQASEKSQKSESQDGADPERSSHMVESMNSSIRQLEMERNQLLSQYEDVNNMKESLLTRVEELVHEKDSHTPAMLNGTQVTKDQFDTLSRAMKMLETKYTHLIGDKADLKDENEQLEHLVMQLQGETDTIGEYISLYQHQRQLLLQREQQKEEYIGSLARDREEMQGKLGQLQVLVMQLLQERSMLHTYHQNSAHNASTTANHFPTTTTTTTAYSNQPSTFGANLDSSQLDELGINPDLVQPSQVSSIKYQEYWPDYTSDSSADSDISEVDAIVTTRADVAQDAMQVENVTNENATSSQQERQQWDIPVQDNTAQKIMHLLSEIGHSNVVEKVPFTERNFLPCACCTGQLQVV
ncbi:golgin subfamily A member 2-like isoform X2 [Lineus longissimus]|uniref:golgin subfamily A member 2-like isoform X2 n=1 Tax=Lineus longissimus TaxID=88925 RepID=UPI002B4D113D